MEYQYKLLKADDDYKQATIEKGGITSEFTIAEVEAMQARNKKALAETEGNLKIKEAEISNIDHFHPMIKDMTGPELTAAWMYKENKDFVQKAGPVIESLKEAIEQNDKMIADCMEMFGFVPAIDPVISSDNADEPKVGND